MDCTAGTAALGSVVTDIGRLLPGRLLDPVLGGVLIQARADGLVLAGTDRERAVRLPASATVHTEGTVLVPARPLAETLRALDAPLVRLVVEGSRLAIRTDRARFALPLLDVDLHPGVAEPPPLIGDAAAADLLPALAAVSGAASKDDALPLFTGVHLRSIGPSLRLVATDRYRLAIAELSYSPAEGAGEYDVLVPANLAAELVRQAAGAQRIALHADADRVVFAWAQAQIGSALLAAPFPAEDRYLGDECDATAEVSAEALAAAVRRAGLYADGRGSIVVELGEGELRVRGESPDVGEAEESVKAETTGRLTQTYRARYLLDALRAFGSREIRVALKQGLKSTVFTPVGEAGLRLRYVVMPILPRTT
ncbi:MAG TPA: DNA polymerase III subunit beta [Pseudonocardiaceae bacterium]|jgi:DNA polymerase-3 subunit beta|nr:DNA polymerase III subunit beta [Pseudonocardiaceae bacterium]